MKNKIIHNKLVRDKIPEKIKNGGELALTKILDDKSYQESLNEKLIEECNELFLATNNNAKTEELADILEVLKAIADNYDITMEEVEKARLLKLEKLGAFKNKFYLESTMSK